MSDSKIFATWSISLDADCPACMANVDLIRDDKFVDMSIPPLECGRNVKTKCPFCDHEFNVELEY